VGRDGPALHRPACASRGIRPAARRGGVAARRLIATLGLALALWGLFPAGASADTLTPQAYRQRLADVRALLVRARSAADPDRATALDQARSLLRRTESVALPGGDTIDIDDRALGERITASTDAIAGAIDQLDVAIASTDRAAARGIDAALADRALADVLRDTQTRNLSPSLADSIVRAIFSFFSGLRGPGIDFGLVWPLLGAMGVAVILFIIAVLGRALPERIRSEIAVREAARPDALDPALHLRAADEALATGRARDAIHALYLFTLTSLAAREAIRYDPALTDRELLIRAVGIPNADSLRALVTLYERSWFGLREPSAAEGRHARSLATRVAE